ncbi:UV DNA damage repair endonuclease UvsE [Paenibacillus glacialis]|uniref:UV damage endonuclease UvdE n=1 Tax=Paenibacillus glacialis TaxID=494026 RepID=A0A168INE2_9BACL|nr:UV DNA damage repair endonuclease UvsE [Paenibacillus glacialis]OAB39504.1 UV damage endonuclease UvdE [Paenibacillus glacialis]
MIVRFGFVAMSMIVQNSSPSKTMTMASFNKIADRDAALRKLERIGLENLHNTLRILKHCIAHEIKVYRFSSKLVPLATHPDLTDWNPMAVLQDSFAEIGDYVNKHGMRVSFHPDHFTVLSTPRSEVLINSVRDLHHHVTMLTAMGLTATAKNNIHIGGAYGDKLSAAARFEEHFSQLDVGVKERLTLENDDKTFNALETLRVCQKTGLPMVIDIHHQWVNNEGETPWELWPDILKTWQSTLAQADALPGVPLAPKIHVSSPRSTTDIRSHADGIEIGSLLDFLRHISRDTGHLDVMIEAKNKDVALFELMKDMGQFASEGVTIRDGASIEILP